MNAPVVVRPPKVLRGGIDPRGTLLRFCVLHPREMEITSRSRAVLIGLLLVGCGSKTALSLLDAGPACITDPDCDDAVACTEDRCQEESCIHVPVDRVCDDGVFCNGSEICDPLRGCTERVSPCPDDGVACTEPTCDEETQTCGMTLRDDLCPLGQTCDPGDGCTGEEVIVRVHDADRFYTLDPRFLSAEPAGAIGFGGFDGVTDLALGAVGETYITTTSEILVRDASGEWEGFARPSVFSVALHARADGTLFGAGEELIFRVDPATGNIFPYAFLPGGARVSGDLTTVDGRMFVTVEASIEGGDDLYEVPGEGEVARRVGSTGYVCVWGLTDVLDELHGFTCEGHWLRIDAETGVATELDVLPFDVFGAATR